MQTLTNTINTLKQFVHSATRHNGRSFCCHCIAFLEELQERQTLLHDYKWHLLSEQLPPKSGNYLVTCDFKGRRYTEIKTYYKDSIDYWTSADDEYLTPEGRRYTKIVAWMYIPKSYKENSKSNE